MPAIVDRHPELLGEIRIGRQGYEVSLAMHLEQSIFTKPIENGMTIEYLVEDMMGVHDSCLP